MNVSSVSNDSVTLRIKSIYNIYLIRECEWDIILFPLLIDRYSAHLIKETVIEKKMFIGKVAKKR